MRGLKFCGSYIRERRKTNSIDDISFCGWQMVVKTASEAVKQGIWCDRHQMPCLFQNPYCMRFRALFQRLGHRHSTGDSGANHRVVAQINWMKFRVFCFHLKCSEILYFQGFVGITVNQRIFSLASADLPFFPIWGTKWVQDFRDTFTRTTSESTIHIFRFC